MSEFFFGTTTISVAQPCITTVTCAKTTICRPQGASVAALGTVPPDLEALRRQLTLLEQAGFDHVGYLVTDPAAAQRVEQLLSQLNR